ncbi:MAG: DUF1329 domain-containing protein [Deltaproteobacteria bacterium]|nr:DUF1329 domain-containing protein [Deltaproteobacteria bacterium]
MKDYKELNYRDYWTRRGFLKAAGAWAGAGLLQPLLPLIGSGKSIAAAYPDEVLAIEKYTKGRVKPGMVISKDNAELIKDIAPEGLIVELQRGGQIRIAPTDLRPEAVNPRYWVEATLKNKGQAVLDKKGQLWHKDGRPWSGGTPFPEPTTGLEAMWNFKFNPRRFDDLRRISEVVSIDSNGAVLRRDGAIYMQIQAVGRLVVEPKPFLPKYKEELHRTLLSLTAPFDVYGLAVATTVYYDAAKLPDTDLYIPTLRRTRRVPSTQRFESASPYSVYYVSDLDIQNDPVLTWSWKLAGKKPMLAPSVTNIGARAKGATKQDFIFPPSDEKFPRSTWELRPEMLLVDGVPHLQGANYSRKRVYVDGIHDSAQITDIWDMAGKLWKFFVFITGNTGASDNAGGTAPDLTGILFADLQRDYHSNVNFFDKVGDIDFRVNAGLTIDDWITQSAMLRRARR